MGFQAQASFFYVLKQDLLPGVEVCGGVGNQFFVPDGIQGLKVGAEHGIGLALVHVFDL